MSHDLKRLLLGLALHIPNQLPCVIGTQGIGDHFEHSEGQRSVLKTVERLRDELYCASRLDPSLGRSGGVTESAHGKVVQRRITKRGIESASVHLCEAHNDLVRTLALFFRELL